MLVLQEVAKLQARVAALETQVVESRAAIADNKAWVEKLKPCLEWKSRIEALEAASTRSVGVQQEQQKRLTIVGNGGGLGDGCRLLGFSCRV